MVAIVTEQQDGTSVPDDTVLSPAERAELEQLRAEVATLRSQVAAAQLLNHPRCRARGRVGSGGVRWSPPC